MPIIKATVIPFLLILLLMGIQVPLSAQSTPASQSQVKAVFLYNFTQFVDWPDSAFSEAADPMVIGVVGEDLLGPYLDAVVDGERINGRPLVVKRFKQDDEINNCHILFVNVPNLDEAVEIIESVKGQSILTVSDIPGFLRNGGMIRFYNVNKKIQFQINPEASKSADLKISSKLLRMAEIITPQ